MELLIVFLLIVGFAVAAGLRGADSREGFDDAPHRAIRGPPWNAFAFGPPA